MRRHNNADRLLEARVTGILGRYASRTPVDVEAAVREIHAVTTDPHLLGHCWPPAPESRPLFWPDFPHPFADQERRILAAAGADPQPPWWEVPDYEP